jgi:hypothetical protein
MAEFKPADINAALLNIKKQILENSNLKYFRHKHISPEIQPRSQLMVF